MIIAAAAIGFHNTASMFVLPVTEELGFSRGEFTFFRTIVIILSAALMPLYGRLATNMSLKKLMLVGTTLNGLAMAAYSFGTALWHFYLISVVSGFVVNAGNFLIIGILISRWFEDKKGIAIGLAFAGSGLGAAIMNPMVSLVIQNFDWRFGFRFSGLASVIVLIPTILLLIKDTPEQMGLRPYRSKKDEEKAIASEPAGLSLYQARKTPIFWLLVLALVGLSVTAGAPKAHTAPYLGDLGYSAAVASAVVSLSMVFLTIGKVLMGYVYDRFGTITGGLVLGIFCILSPIFALMAATNPAAPWLHAVFFGLASTGFSMPVNIYAMKFFGQKDFPAILSALSVVIALGAALSPPLMGFSYDFLDSYSVAWIALVIIGFAIVFSLTIADVLHRRQSK